MIMQRETSRLTLPIGMLAEGRRTTTTTDYSDAHTYNTHALIDENYQEHAHAWVCSALNDSDLAVSWCNARPWLHGYGIWARIYSLSLRG